MDKETRCRPSINMQKLVFWNFLFWNVFSTEDHVTVFKFFSMVACISSHNKMNLGV